MINSYSKSEIYYNLADRWFRMIEFSLIIATLDYFSYKIGSYILIVTYWISWFMFFNWFLELGEVISNRVYKGDGGSKKLLIGLLSMIPFIIVFILLNRVGDILISFDQ